MNASRHWLRAQLEGRTVAITVSFCPGRRFDESTRAGQRSPETGRRRRCTTALATLVPASVAAAVLAGICDRRRRDLLAQLSRDDRRRLAHALVEWPLPVAGTRGYNYAEVTAGGVALTEIDPATMESRVCPGLYLVGEILDVDGRIGGFNFQWAWASAHVAARGLAGGFPAEAVRGSRTRLSSTFVARFRAAFAGAGSLVACSTTRRVANVRRPCSSKSITVWCSLTSTSVPGP